MPVPGDDHQEQQQLQGGTSLSPEDKVRAEEGGAREGTQAFGESPDWRESHPSIGYRVLRLSCWNLVLLYSGCNCKLVGLEVRK